MSTSTKSIPSKPFKLATPRVTTDAQLRKKEAHWAIDFETIPGLHQKVAQALENLGVLDMLPFEDGLPTSWADVTAGFFDNDYTLHVTGIKGATVEGGPALYALPGYGWDGGNDISTETINLKSLALSDIVSGPYAELVVRSSQAYPGIALHFYDANSIVVLHLL